MDETAEVERTRVGDRLIVCLIVPLALLPLSGILGYFDNTTELTPGHEDALQLCFVVAGLAGLAWGALGIHRSRGMATWRRIPIAFSFALASFIAVFLVSNSSANIVEGLIDFPSARTSTHQGMLIIWRAYQTHGKGRSWNIQTTPIWSNLDVTESDYNFMLSHRGPTDHGENPDEISSHGFFCARVTLQQSGGALRVMHAGSRKLPAGTIMICPTAHPEAPPQ